MKDLHPTDTRYRGPASPARAARAPRFVDAPKTPPRAPWEQAPEPPRQSALERAAQKAPALAQMIPLGLLHSDLDSADERRKVSSKEWGATALKVVGGLILYFLLSNMSGTQMVQF